MGLKGVLRWIDGICSDGSGDRVGFFGKDCPMELAFLLIAIVGGALITQGYFDSHY